MKRDIAICTNETEIVDHIRLNTCKDYIGRLRCVSKWASGKAAKAPMKPGCVLVLATKVGWQRKYYR